MLPRKDSDKGVVGGSGCKNSGSYGQLSNFGRSDLGLLREIL